MVLVADCDTVVPNTFVGQAKLCWRQHELVDSVTTILQCFRQATVAHRRLKPLHILQDEEFRWSQLQRGAKGVGVRDVERMILLKPYRDNIEEII